MASRRMQVVAFGAVAALVVVGLAAPAVASPAPVSACPPCGDGFVRAAANHGLDTDVRHGRATVRAHANGSATWTARVVPTNESVTARLAANRSLARAVAADSFGVRYGSGIEHELLGTAVDDGAFVVRYRTLGVVRESPFGTRTLTYFRDSPGAYVYTELGADELTVVAPPGMTIARGFGDVEGGRMRATDLPGVQDGPFVVFAPEGSAAPGLLGSLAVADALGGVIARNVAVLVALPGGILVLGLAGIRRYADATTRRSPTRLGGLVAGGGVLLLAWTIASEASALPAVTANLLVGCFGGAVLLALGAGVAVRPVRRHLAPRRLVAAGVAVAAVAVAVFEGVPATGDVHRTLSIALAGLPAAVALGWLDARAAPTDRTVARRLFVGIAATVLGALLVFSPLTALGGTLFLLAPILLAVLAVAGVVAAAPLYLLGAAGAGARTVPPSPAERARP